MARLHDENHILDSEPNRVLNALHCVLLVKDPSVGNDEGVKGSGFGCQTNWAATTATHSLAELQLHQFSVGLDAR